MDVGAERSRGLAFGTYKILIVDDARIDAELSMMELRRAGLLMECVVAADERELRSALATFAPDVILCDFGFPDFDGFEAQRIVREVYPETPLIFVSGTIGEDKAVMALQSGAVDYVLKSNLLRLPSAVQRAVRDATERKHLERSLAESEERARRQAQRLESLWRSITDVQIQGPHLIEALLREAAGSIRPNQAFRGLLGRVVDDLVTFMAVGESPGYPATSPPSTIGHSVALKNTLLMGESRTLFWDDLACLPFTPAVTELFGWRSAICTSFNAGGARYILKFGSCEATHVAFGSEDVAYVEVLGSSLARWIDVDGLNASLREAEERSRHHAKRLEALWQLVNDPSVPEDEVWHAMLVQAAASMRPGHPYRGTLWRVDGAQMVIVAVAEPPNNAGNERSRVGFVAPLADTMVGPLLADGGGTRSWNDLRNDPHGRRFADGDGPRSLISTTFTAAGSTWALTFASKTPTVQPLRQEEHAYIEILAAFLANRVVQGWQFERIQYQQAHDVLTGLLNRSQFRSRARMASRLQSRFAIITVDISAFREVNESYGHQMGDAVLVEVGNALLARATREELVGRVGGNVFSIFVGDAPSREHVESRAAAFFGAFDHPFSTGDREGKDFIARTASLGIAVAPDDGSTIDAILAHADVALTAAKARGHGTTAFYEARMEGDALRRATLRNELTDALANDQFTLYYQPHVELRTGRVTGCEALIRWNHPQRGLLLPGLFIPFAEQSGLIVAIDDWVLRNAMSASLILGAMRPDFRLFFNLSGRQAGDPLLVRSLCAAARGGIRLAGLGVEITESDAMRDVEATRRVCRALRRLGVRVAIDDFGTGYSSLSFLKRLPVDLVKIDRSFVGGVVNDPHGGAIAEAIISIAARFGFESLGEGAEAPEEVEWLAERSCHYVQGYAVSHPLPMAEFLDWLSARDASVKEKTPPERG